ncbi:MAG: hypothetical protein AAGI11_15220 [Pseudomonadota bacterium]
MDIVANGVVTSGGNAPDIAAIQVGLVATQSTLSNYFNGPFPLLEFVNATPLQGIEHVPFAATRTVTVPSRDLSNATLSGQLLYRSGDQTIFTGSVAILTVASDLFVSGVNVDELRVDGQVYGSETLVDGQHYDIELDVSGGTLTTIGALATGGHLYQPTFIDKSDPAMIKALGEEAWSDPADTINPPWQYSAGTYSIDGSQGGLTSFQSSVLEAGKRYLLEFTADIAAGVVTGDFAALDGFTASSGLNRFVGVPGGSGLRPLRFFPNSSAVAEISSMSVREILDWHEFRYDLSGANGDTALNLDPVTGQVGAELQAGGDFANGLGDVTFDNSDNTDCVTTLSSETAGGIRITRGAGGIANAPRLPAFDLEAGKTYKRTIRVLGGSNAGGRVFLTGVGGSGTFIAGAGANTYEQIFTSGGTGSVQPAMWCDANHWVEIDDVSIVEWPHATWINKPPGAAVLLDRESRRYEYKKTNTVFDNDGNALYTPDSFNPPSSNYATTDYASWSAQSATTITDLGGGVGEIYLPGVAGSEQAFYREATEDWSGRRIYGHVEVRAKTPADAGNQVRMVIRGNGPDFTGLGMVVHTLTEDWAPVTTLASASGLDWSGGVRLSVQQVSGSPVETSLEIRNPQLIDLKSATIHTNVSESDFQ